MRKIYAGIGSRQTPADILVRMFRISSVLFGCSGSMSSFYKEELK